MYHVPKNPQLPRITLVILIFTYYAIISAFFALDSCSYIGTLVIGIAVSPPETLSSGMNVEIIWTALLLLINASRLGLFIGVLKIRRWGYRGIIMVEIFTIMHMLYQLFFDRSSITPQSLLVIGAGVIDTLILSYLLQPSVRQFFTSANT